MRLSWTLGEDDLRFRVEGSDKPIFPISDNDDAVIDELSRSRRLRRLEELWSDGVAEQIDAGAWRIPAVEAFRLTSEDRAIFDIPARDDLKVAVAVTGLPGNESLRLHVEVDAGEHRDLERSAARVGPFYIIPGERPFLVEEPLFELLEHVRIGPGGSALEDDLAYLGRAKKLAKQCEADVDRYLEREEYFFPDAAELDVLQKSVEELELRARLPADQAPPIPSSELLSQRERKVHTRAPKGRRRQRVVLSPEVRGQLSGIRESKTIRGADVPRFAENPEAYLPSGIDLSEFSERVKGIREITYNSRPYLHLNRSAGGWFEGVPGVRLDKPADGDGADASGESGARPSSISPETYRELVRRAEETGDEFVRHGDGWVRVDPDQGQQFLSTVDRFEASPAGTIRIPERAVLDIYENLEALEFDLPPRDAIGIHIDVQELPDPLIPATFAGELKGYQRLGYRWLANLDDKQTGGLLADDMGLGKTVQVIAHMARLSVEKRLRPALVVCPKTLMSNWERELDRFFPAHGRIARLGARRVPAETLKTYDIVLASYDTVRRRQLDIAKVDWELVVSDEAQYAKNPTAQRTSALKALKGRSRVALTGTPVENGMIEFWCIMDFVRPGLLGSWQDFRSGYERPLIEAADEEERRPLVSDLLGKIGRHYLRRLKEDVLQELPERYDNEIPVQISQPQMEIYRDLARAAAVGGRGAALAAITKLLIVCGHPAGLGVPDRFEYRSGDCPKLDATLDVLERVRHQGRKALIFTRFKNLQHILQTSIRSRFNIWPEKINGDVTANRQFIIDLFSETPGFNVLILSQEVGGVGLNITAANHVIHYTRPWNPAKENQATDRVHRLGQDKTVHVHFPIVQDDRFKTVEARLDELLKEKAGLARDVLRPSKEMRVHPEELLECVSDVAEKAEA